MPNWFFVSDTHFRHHNILKFEQCFSGFTNIDDRDDFLVQMWNSKVNKDDKIWHFGDIAFNSGLSVLPRLNGRFDLLLMGNHEHKNIKEYLPHFRDIKSVAEISELGALCSHYPVHPSQLEERYKVNIHGHVHSKSLTDDRYINISIENIGFAPISYDELKAKIP